MTGIVKWFNDEKGYGFINAENLDDIFVHYTSIDQKGFKSLKTGDVVSFKLVETLKGLQAIDVKCEVMSLTA